MSVAASFAARFISDIFLLSSDFMENSLANLSYRQGVLIRVAGVVGNRDGWKNSYSDPTLPTLNYGS
jgi:hypothetical protein